MSIHTDKIKELHKKIIGEDIFKKWKKRDFQLYINLPIHLEILLEQRREKSRKFKLYLKYCSLNKLDPFKSSSNKMFLKDLKKKEPSPP